MSYLSIFHSRGHMRATDPAHRHDRLALRLSVIISRLLAGESLSLKALSGEFGVSERTLRRDFSQRLLHLDLTGDNGCWRLRTNQMRDHTPVHWRLPATPE